MSTQKFAAGTVGLSWTSIMTTELNSLGSGSCIQSSAAIVNGSNLDLMCDISFIATLTCTTTGQPYLGIYLLPLNADGSTYGDGLFAAAKAYPPASTYWVGNIGYATAGGSQTIVGTIRGIVMPPGSWKVALYNAIGNTTATWSLPTQNSTLYYRTYNYVIV